MDANIVLTQVTAGASAVWILQVLKNWKAFPLLQSGQKYASRTASVIAAFFIHGGVSYTWDPQLDVNGNRHLVLAIPTFLVFITYIWHWFGQYTLQELMYQGTINKSGITTDATGATPARVSPSGDVVVSASSKA
jgi:hypothetical protein